MAKFEPIQNWQKDISAERSIYEVAKKSFSLIGGKREGTICFWSLIASVIVPPTVTFSFPNLVGNVDRQLDFSYNISSILLAYYAGIFGFVLAAFSVIVGLLGTDTLVSLAKVKKDSRSVSEFKFLLFGFVYALFIFGFFILFSVLIWVMASPEGIVNLLPDTGILRAISLCVNCIILVLFVYSIFQLKTLIWNVYQIVLAVTIVRGSASTK